MKNYLGNRPEALWLSVSPHLKGFDQRLLVQLTQSATIRRWEYCQTADEPCCIDAVVESLHDYMSQRAQDAERSRPVHLLGHGVSGVVGLLYARRYPQHVASLTLLSVGPQPAVNWQAHYYALRQLLPCSREMILMQVARLLFGEEPVRFANALGKLLARDLDSNLTLHSLAHRSKVEPGGVDVPLLVCNGENDVVTSQHSSSWVDWKKPQDRIWNCAQGNHFFHFHQPKATARAIADYWHGLTPENQPLSISGRFECR